MDPNTADEVWLSHTHTQRHTHTDTHTRTHAHTHAHTDTHTRAHTQTHAHTHAHTATDTHVHSRTHTQTRARTDTHTHLLTQRKDSQRPCSSGRWDSFGPQPPTCSESPASPPRGRLSLPRVWPSQSCPVPQPQPRAPSQLLAASTFPAGGPGLLPAPPLGALARSPALDGVLRCRWVPSLPSPHLGGSSGPCSHPEPSGQWLPSVGCTQGPEGSQLPRPRLAPREESCRAPGGTSALPPLPSLGAPFPPGPIGSHFWGAL